MAFTHMRGAVIPTSVSEGFLRACILRSVAYQFHAFFINTSYENCDWNTKNFFLWLIY